MSQTSEKEASGVGRTHVILWRLWLLGGWLGADDICEKPSKPQNQLRLNDSCVIIRLLNAGITIETLLDMIEKG
jgi:hypothetical protein